MRTSKGLTNTTGEKLLGYETAQKSKNHSQKIALD
jgi:hypothetical protein